MHMQYDFITIDRMKLLCCTVQLVATLLILIPRTATKPWTRSEISRLNIVGSSDMEKVVVATENMNYEEEVDNQMGIVKKKKLSKYELTLLRCCSNKMDTQVGRCFEVNGFGGINFLTSPCEYLDEINT